MINFFKKLFNCYIFGLHQWTCKTDKGIKPDKKIETLTDFAEYAKSYCDLCGKVNPVSQKFIDEKKKSIETIINFQIPS